MKTFKELKAEAVGVGYTLKVKTTDFQSLGYRKVKFITFYKDGKKVEMGMGSKAYWDAFDGNYPMIRVWKKEEILDEEGNKMVIH